jgi:hypothetical protein
MWDNDEIELVKLLGQMVLKQNKKVLKWKEGKKLVNI